MRLNLLYLRSRLCISRCLKRSVLTSSFCSVSVNQRASYCCRRKQIWEFFESDDFGNLLLLDGKIDENRVVSPLSFQVVLSLLAAGSCGYSRRQLLKFFNADSVDRLNWSASQISDRILADIDPAVGPGTRCSNGLWLDRSLTLKPSFKQILDSYYRAALNPVDFQKAPHVRQHVNSWVENETSGLVKDLMCEGSLNNSIKLVFTNALYFKGAWHTEGPRPSIRDKKPPNENRVAATFMIAKRKEFGRCSEPSLFLHHTIKTQSEDMRVINMQFFYPWTDTDDLQGGTTFVTETLMDVGGQMTPKFIISSEVEACNVLRQRGVTSPFSGGELTGMLSCFDSEKLYVSNIFQKAVIKINEGGIEAATATAAIVMSGTPPDLLPVPTIDYHSRFPNPLCVGRDEIGTIRMAKARLMIQLELSPLPR